MTHEQGSGSVPVQGTEHTVRHLRQHAPFRLRPHHAQPYRKRHLVGLVFFALTTITSCAAGLRYLSDRYDKQLNASLSAYEQVSGRKVASAKVQVRSTLGYQVTFDTATLRVVGTSDDDVTGQRSYTDELLGVPRAYSSLSLLPIAASGSSMSIATPATVVTDGKKREDVVKSLIESYSEPASDAYVVTKVSDKVVSLGGLQFTQTTFRTTLDYTPKGTLRFPPTATLIYVGFLPSGRPIVIKIVAPEQDMTVRAVFDRVLASFSASTEVSLLEQQKITRSLAGVQAGGDPIAQAAERLGLAPARALAATQTVLDQSRLVSLNVPAVVKLYHVLCGSIEYRGTTLTTDICSAESGTGFFISGDGYIATNGHVVAGGAKEAAIQAMTPDLLTTMLQIDGYAPAEISRIIADLRSSDNVDAIISQAVHDLPDDAIRLKDKKDFYVVALGSDVPKLDQITKDRTFRETTTTKLATLAAIDYDASEIFSDDGFSHSDVAVLKVSGTNYPFVRLGSLDGILQGASVTVIGYPGDAEENNLIDTSTLQSTTTLGVVSAVRMVNGGVGRVVQSDVNIGHGNSGGPAIDQYGNVFGIATYIVGGSDTGEGNISYLRDVQDIRNLLKAHTIQLSLVSDTQRLWEEGLRDFYSAHYKAAISKFRTVSKQYSPHDLARQYILLAEQKIANGEEATPAWVPWSIAAGIVASLSGLIMVIVFIVRHRAHHHMYKALQAGFVHTPLTSLHMHAPHANSLHSRTSTPR